MPRKKDMFPTARDAGTGFTLTICVGGNVIGGTTVSEFLSNVLRYIDENDLLPALFIPFPTSGANYLIAKTARHPSGVDFTSFAEYVSPKSKIRLFINTNHPRFFGLRQGARILEQVGLKVSLPKSNDTGASKPR